MLTVVDFGSTIARDRYYRPSQLYQIFILAPWVWRKDLNKDPCACRRKVDSNPSLRMNKDESPWSLFIRKDVRPSLRGIMRKEISILMMSTGSFGRQAGYIFDEVNNGYHKHITPELTQMIKVLTYIEYSVKQ